jgi:hypothetical protein
MDKLLRGKKIKRQNKKGKDNANPNGTTKKCDF